MTIPDFISQQESSRQDLLKSIHDIIVSNDYTVTAKVGKMMGKEMILYMAGKPMKYGLASMKDYMSLHVMPMYGSPRIYDRYKKLLSSAKFQKGCINFKTAEDMPTHVVRELIGDCAPIDLAAIREEIRKDPLRKYF
jgi:hypothetical protein